MEFYHLISSMAEILVYCGSMQAVETFGFGGEDHMGKITFPPIQV